MIALGPLSAAASVLAFCVVSSLQASASWSTSDIKLHRYQQRNKVLHDLLVSEGCFKDELVRMRRDIKMQSKSDTLLEVELKFYQHLTDELIECRKNKLEMTHTSTKPASPKVTATTTVTQASTTSTATTKSTTTPKTFTSTATKTTSSTSTTSIPNTTIQPCKLKTGYSKLAIDFIYYHNPSNNKATGSACDEDGSFCDIFVEVCISPVRSRDCSLFNITTDVLQSSSYVVFTSDLGGHPNPLIVDFGLREWKGVNILINTWDKDDNSDTDDIVDEFSYNYTDGPGNGPIVVDIQSVTSSRDSRLRLSLRNYCPAPITTTTPAPTTTSPLPQPAACQSAINLTEYWRKDHNGSNIQPVNGQPNYDNKWMVNAGRPWFRFTGAAGNRLLDHCVPGLSCGTVDATWSDAPMPASIGVVTKFNAIQSYNGDCYYSQFECSAMRCSDQPHDLIYRYDGPGSGDEGFCGMD